jgi:hypothetical protein
MIYLAILVTVLLVSHFAALVICGVAVAGILHSNNRRKRG